MTEEPEDTMNEETMAVTSEGGAVATEVSLYELRDVTKTFRVGDSVVNAVAGIDLEIRPGELVAIEGPSGSGKSTLLQLLGGLDRATSGSVQFAGRDLTAIGDKELTNLRAREIGFVFQSFNLIPTLTAAENVELAMVPTRKDKKTARAHADELLEMVGLAGRRDHLPSRLSGGEQQRVAIARALANGPRVILADEPTGNLDTATADEVVTILRGLSSDRGVTVVIVTHAEDVARNAQRRVRMRDGRLLDDTRWRTPGV
jgi:putative ABC transport system ATP-binding protein